jgi:hypothetical protein
VFALQFGAGISYTTFTETIQKIGMTEAALADAAEWDGDSTGGVTNSITNSATVPLAMVSLATARAHLLQYQERPHLAPTLAKIQVEIVNTGKVRSDHAVLLYVAPPPSPSTGSLEPLQDLVGFEKVHLGPGESTIVVFNLTAFGFSTVRLDGQRRAVEGEWMLHFQRKGQEAAVKAGAMVLLPSDNADRG